MGAKQTGTGPAVGECFAHVTYVSEQLGGQVLVVLEHDGDPPENYQAGVVYGEITLHEVWTGGVNWGPHITDAVANVLAYEAAGAQALQVANLEAA